MPFSSSSSSSFNFRCEHGMAAENIPEEEEEEEEEEKEKEELKHDTFI